MSTTTDLINESVSIEIAATPEVVFDLVTDVTRMGEWSPETVEARWLDGHTDAAVGHRFQGKNKLGFLTWATKPEVTELERGRTFAFEVPGKGGPEWRYEFRPTPTGVEVTESVVQETRSPAPLRLLQRLGGAADRGQNLRAGMTTTLERLKAAAEASDAAPDSADPGRVTA